MKIAPQSFPHTHTVPALEHTHQNPHRGCGGANERCQKDAGALPKKSGCVAKNVAKKKGLRCQKCCQNVLGPVDNWVWIGSHTEINKVVFYVHETHISDCGNDCGERLWLKLFGNTPFYFGQHFWQHTHFFGQHFWQHSHFFLATHLFLFGNTCFFGNTSLSVGVLAGILYGCGVCVWWSLGPYLAHILYQSSIASRVTASEEKS